MGRPERNADFDVQSNAPQERDYLGFSYSSNQTHIDAMLSESPIALVESASEETIRSVLNGLLRIEAGCSNPHLIFFGDSARAHLISDLTAKRSDPAATVHVLAQSPVWETEEVRLIAKTTGGIYRSVSENDVLPEICAEAYSSLLHHYRIGWRESAENLELEINSEIGKASASYEVEAFSIAEERLTA